METAVIVLYKIIYIVPQIIYSLINQLFSTSTLSVILPFYACFELVYDAMALLYLKFFCKFYLSTCKQYNQ